MQQQKITECGKCHAVTKTENLLLLTNLVYPEHPTLKQIVSFASVLCSSLCPEQTTPAWCDTCNKYQPTSHSRRSAPVISVSVFIVILFMFHFWFQAIISAQHIVSECWNGQLHGPGLLEHADDPNSGAT